MLLYAVRHAESTINARLGGGADPELTELGMRQSIALSERLSQAGPEAIYASPYRRAVATAEPLARQTGLPIYIRNELCEFNTPGWEALKTFVPPTLEDVCRFCSAAARDPDDLSPLAFPPLTEVLADVIERTRRFAGFLKQRWTHPDDVVVAFGHGLPIARLIDAWLSDSPSPAFRFIIDNAAVSALRFDGKTNSLICLNEASHLVGLPLPALSNFDVGHIVKPRHPGYAW